MRNAHGEARTIISQFQLKISPIHQYAQIPDEDDLGITCERDMPNSHHLNVCGNAISY